MQKKVVLITGASSGMGKEFAKSLISENYVVYVAARRIEQMKDLEELGAYALKMDITSQSDIDAAINEIESKHNGVDILINNAGFGLYGAVEDIKISDARYQFEVNLFGLAYITQRVLPKMRSKNSGTIINMSSMGGKVYMPLGSWYHATKHALEGWSDCLRIELKQFGIKVVIIEPGAILTEFGGVMAEPLLKNSGAGNYAQMAIKMANATQKTYSKGSASNPDVITKLVLKAIKAKNPKTRYVAGKFAKPMIFIRKWFGDKIFDMLLFSMLK